MRSNMRRRVILPILGAGMCGNVMVGGFRATTTIGKLHHRSFLHPGPVTEKRNAGFSQTESINKRWTRMHMAETPLVEDKMNEARDVSLHMAETSALEEEETTDPLAEVAQGVKSMDLNAFLNTAAIVVIILAVLSKVATVDAGMMRGWTAAEVAYRTSVDNWMGYSTFLDNAPVSTKAITSATVYTIGDFIAQRTEGTSMGELDRWRIVRSLLAGLIGHGPLSHVWYDWSEGIFNDVLHWTAWWSFFPKVLLDQTTWGPFWNNTYILLLGLMKRESLESIWSDVKRTTVPLIVSGLKLWPLAHCVTYGLIPVENRLLWVDAVEILWVTILATQASGAGHEHVEDVAVPPAAEGKVPVENEKR